MKDVYCGLFKRKLTDETFRRVAGVSILIVAGIAWLVALPGHNLDTVLFSAGGLVASLIWPIIAGLFWKRCNRALVLCGIVGGVITGYVCWFYVQTYVAALAGGAVSMIFTLLSRVVAPKPFPERTTASPNVE